MGYNKNMICKRFIVLVITLIALSPKEVICSDTNCLSFKECYAKGVAAYKTKNFKQAIPFLEVALKKWTSSKKNKKHVTTKKYLADAYYNIGIAIQYLEAKYDEAILYCSKAIELNPSHLDAYVCRGEIYVAKGQIDKGIRDYTKAIKIDWKYVDAYKFRGRAYFEKEEYNKAVKDFSKALGLVPDYPIIYFDRAIVYSIIGEYDKAIEDFNKHIKLTGEDGGVAAFINLGYAYLDSGRLSEAEKNFKRVLEIASTEPLALMPLGEIEELQGNKEMASKLYQEVDEILRYLKIDIFSLCYFSALKGKNLEETEKLAIESIKGNSQKTSFLVLLGLIYYKEGKYDEAIKQLEQVLILETNGSKPLRTKSYYYLALAYLGKKDVKNAKKYVLKSLSLNPKYPWATKLYKEITEAGSK